MAVRANERNRPKRASDPEPTVQSDFNEDDYLAGRGISVGFVSRCSRRLSLNQPSSAEESPRTERSSRNETHQKLNASSKSQKAPTKAEVNGGFIHDARRARPTVDNRTSHVETVQSREKLPLKSYAGEKVHTKQRENDKTPVTTNHIKCATRINKTVNEESIHDTGTAHIKSHDKGKIDSKGNVRIQPHLDEEISATPELRKEKVCFNADAKRRVVIEPRQNKTHHDCRTSKDTLPSQDNTREETTNLKTNGKGTDQIKDQTCVKLDIKDGQKPGVKVDQPDRADHKRMTCDETSVSLSCNDEHKDTETEETNDTDKVYNYLFYIGTRIPSKSFSRLCRSVNKPTMPSSSSLSS